MHRVQQVPVQLQHRLAAGEHHEAVHRAGEPRLRDGGGQRGGVGEALAADEVRIAEPTGCRGAVHFPPGPQIAAGEPAEHGGAAGLAALALQRGEEFFDDVAHA